MKTYTFKLEIFEGDDEFWENIKGEHGIIEVKELVKTALFNAGFQTEADHKLTMMLFSHDDEDEAK